MADRRRSPRRGKEAAGPGNGRRSAPEADPARRAAYDVLRAVQERGSYANLLLPSLLAERGISGRDAALATELTYGTLRGQGTYDAVLDACVDRGVSSVDAAVLPLLRLGAHQLLSMRTPPHAAVSATVDLARRAVAGRLGSFVNAVLRKVAARDLEEWTAVEAPDAAEDPAGNLAVRLSHPRWIVEALADALGEDPGSLDDTSQTAKLLAAHNERPGVTLLAKPGRAEAADLAAAGAVPARYSPFGASLEHGDPARLELVRQGRVLVADEASQLVALALSRVRVSDADARWLDTCAGPGGKAALLAGLAGRRGATLLAGEVHPARARLVQGAVARSVGDAGRVVVADSTQPPWRGESFDRVLVDAPCTGLGALRRRPEARWRRGPDSLAQLVSLQRELLGRALDAVRPGGVVAYVTCSPHVAETRDVVQEVTGARRDVEVLRAAEYLGEVPDLAAGPEGRYVQFWPHRHGTDAMFLALLRRR